MAETRLVAFSSGDLTLEGILHLPLDHRHWPAAIVCHPHPLYGGDMYNGVVMAVCGALAEAGWVALRFNFRGVGRSEGVHSGSRETEDVVGAIGYLRGLISTIGQPIVVVGYSFGARIGMQAGAEDGRVSALVGISPPLAIGDFSFLDKCLKPKAFLLGDRDQYVDAGAVSQLLTRIPEPKTERLFAGVDHFWFGAEPAAAFAVVEYLNEWLPTYRPS